MTYFLLTRKLLCTTFIFLTDKDGTSYSSHKSEISLKRTCIRHRERFPMTAWYTIDKILSPTREQSRNFQSYFDNNANARVFQKTLSQDRVVWLSINSHSYSTLGRVWP